jgi:hypothetical protein
MRTSTTTLMTALMIGSLGLAGSVSACGGYGGGYGGYGYNNYGYNHKKVVVQKIYIEPRYDRCYHPEHCYTYVFPGDTWGSICSREYGNRNLWKNLVSYNGFRSGANLFVGQKLMLPVINSDGSLAASDAPAGTPFIAQTPAVAPVETTQFSAPSAPSAPSAKLQIESEPSLPSVAVGSTVTLDGQEFGSDQGAVRLRISGMALPAEVIEWNGSSAKVKLPAMDLTSAMRADIEVIRADGSLASQSAIQLTPATNRLALGN